jgi:hypothetical protein
VGQFFGERSGNITTQGRERNKRIAEATILLT